MSNDTSVFPVALLENAVTRPITYQGEEVCDSVIHLSGEPMRCPFPMNCLCSTCRLTMNPGGWSANRRATCKAAEEDCLERRNSIRPCVPSHVAYKAERGGNELFCSPWKNVSTLARAAPKPRGHGVSASIRWRRA